MAEEITISGQVRGYDRAPIHMIQVTVYRDMQLVDHVYTDEEGKCRVSVPADEPITVHFDVHWSLTNAREWHPSVVAKIDATGLDHGIGHIRLVEVDSEEREVAPPMPKSPQTSNVTSDRKSAPPPLSRRAA